MNEDWEGKPRNLGEEWALNGLFEEVESLEQSATVRDPSWDLWRLQGMGIHMWTLP